jgi:N-acetylglucosamine kinase-like BadF-type ATPase
LNAHRYLLGIDAGGTKTTALLADHAGAILSRGTAGPANFQVIGHAAAEAALAQAAQSAYAAAGVAHPGIGAVCIGLAGVDRAHERTHFRNWAAAHFPGAAVRIVNDAELVLAAGTPDDWGAALICGTGSIVYGRGVGGARARAGGWGHLLGDEGSGYAIGLAALRALLRAYDGRSPATELTPRVLDHWQLSTPPDLLHRVYQEHAGKAAIAGLAPLVIDAAVGGDRTAAAIVEEAAAELALAVAAVAQRLAVTGALPCAVAGGLILGAPLLLRRFLAQAESHGLRLDPVTRVVEPALGAIRLARMNGDA